MNIFEKSQLLLLTPENNYFVQRINSYTFIYKITAINFSNKTTKHLE